MCEYLNKNDLNSFDSYIGLGILNGLSVGNLGLLYETNLSKSYGVSLNVKPARLDVSRKGGRTWIPFFLRRRILWPMFCVILFFYFLLNKMI